MRCSCVLDGVEAVASNRRWRVDKEGIGKYSEVAHTLSHPLLVHPPPKITRHGVALQSGVVVVPAISDLQQGERGGQSAFSFLLVLFGHALRRRQWRRNNF